MRIKKLALTSAGLVALGTLSLVIANRAAAVGGSPFQESMPRDAEPLVRDARPDGRAIGSPKAIPRPQLVTQTYYVGDILGIEAGSTSVSVPGQPAMQARRMFDMNPLTDFITTTVAPGTWRIPDQNGSVETKDTNFIVPFHLSISLIIKCQPEVHDQVGNTLRRLRVLLQARDERTLQSSAEPPKSPQAVNAAPASPTRRTSLPPIPAPADPTLPPPLAAEIVPPRPGSRHRVQQLLDELQKEVEKLPTDDN